MANKRSDCEYLYGKIEVPLVPEDVISKRLQALNENLSKLLDIHYLGRDVERIRDIQKAIKLWENINKYNS